MFDVFRGVRPETGTCGCRAIPGTFALAGLIQLVSGVPFGELSARWNGLEGWQRGVLGTLFVLGACGLIFLLLYAFMTLAYDA